MTSIPRLVRAAARVLSKETDVHALPQEATRARTVSAIKDALRDRAKARKRRRWLGPAFAVTVAAAVVVVASVRATRPATRPGDTAVAVAAPGTLTAERVRGDVAVEDSAGRTLPLAEAAIVRVGDRIVSSKGSVTLTLPSGTHVDVESFSNVRVDIAAGTQLVELGGGVVTSRVMKVAPGERFIVRAGDVEVEVRGTVFRVERSAHPVCGTVTKVDVLEGRVVVRAAAVEKQVAAGESWASACAQDEHSTPATASAAAVTAHAVVPPPRRGAPSATNTSPPNVLPPNATPNASAAIAVEPVAASELAAQNALFRAAMAAKSRGDTKGAIALLDTFLQRYPNSPLHEGAAAQRMRLLAGSDPARATTAAREYAARYSNGFARQEADNILHRAP